MDKRPDLYRWAHRESPSPSAPDAARSAAAPRPRIRLERKGRAGKTVTVVEGLHESDGRLREILRALQQACGTGGTCKEHRLELQGDCQARVRAWLQAQGYRV